MCPKGYMKTKAKCLKMITDYEMVTMHYEMNGLSVAPMTIDSARQKCAGSGNVAVLTSDHLDDITFLFEIWRHDEKMGDIWVETTEGDCAVVKVRYIKINNHTCV